MVAEPPANPIAGRNAFLALLRTEGVTHLFGNPGTTELPIMHALADEPDIRYILGLQESIVVAMADGYARASGKLPAINVHVAPGLGNALGTLFTAANSCTPMIITAGQQEQGHGLTEPLLYGPLVEMARPVAKWSVEVNRIHDMPRILRRAAKIAMTPPTGPVFISLPGDVLNDFAALDLGEPTRVETRSVPGDEALLELAETLIESKRPAIVAGNELAVRDGLGEAAWLAECLGAPVFGQTVQSGSCFRSEHPAFLGHLNRSQSDVRQRLEPYDMMIVLGADILRMSVYSETDPVPDGIRIVQISERDHELGKNYFTERAIRADVVQTLRALKPVLQNRLGESRHGRLKSFASSNWSARREIARVETRDLRSHSPLHPRWLMMALADMAPADAIFVDEGITATWSFLEYRALRGPRDYFGNVSGGIGWGIAAAVGVQLAEPQRRTIAIIGDGSAQYSIQAIWSAARVGAPVIFVIVNNGGYRIIKDRLKSFHGSTLAIGMDFEDPPIHATKLAEGYGVQAVRVADADTFEAAFAEALATRAPFVIECMTDRA